MWLVRRVIVLGLLLVVLSASVVAVARVNPTPSRLQALGFDMCEGEPCWQGLRPGVDWPTVLGTLPGLVSNMTGVWSMDSGYLHLTVTITDERLETFSLQVAESSKKIPIAAGDYVMRYGPPCRTVATEDGYMELHYPTFYVLFVDRSASINGLDGRLEVLSTPNAFIFTMDKNVSRCTTYGAPWEGYWQGFTSIAEYRARFGRAGNTTAKP